MAEDKDAALQLPSVRTVVKLTAWVALAILVLIVTSATLTGCAATAGDQGTPSLPGLSAGEATSSPQLAAVLATAGEIEQHFGVRVTLVAVTAGGGLLDIRFRIVDAAKAADLLTGAHLPAVVVPGSGTAIRPPQAPDSTNLTDGQIYFLLYPNSGGAVKPGSTIILTFGDVGLEYKVAS